MSSKATDANVKKLTQLGYSKTRALKALKDCTGNFSQAKAWLERDDKERAEKERQVELLKIAERRESEAKRSRAAFTVSVDDPSKDPLAGEQAKAGKKRRHPCLVQYGSCRYGKFCAFRELPGDTCINYIKGTCIYGDACHNLHPPDIERLRVELLGEGLRGDIVDAPSPQDRGDGEEDEDDDRSGDDTEGDATKTRGGRRRARVLSIPAVPLHASAWSGVHGPAPTHSDPIGEAYSWQQQQQHEDAGRGLGTGDAPKPFLEKLKQAAPTPTRAAALPAPATVGKKVVSAKSSIEETSRGTSGAQPPLGSQLHPCIAQFGMCKFGDACLHAFRPADLCVRYLNGRCHFGSECRFKHQDSSSSPTSSSSLPTNPQNLHVKGTCQAKPQQQQQQQPPVLVDNTLPDPPRAAHSAGGFRGGSTAHVPSLRTAGTCAGPAAGVTGSFWGSNGHGLPLHDAGIVTVGVAQTRLRGAPNIHAQYSATAPGSNGGVRTVMTPFGEMPVGRSPGAQEPQPKPQPQPPPSPAEAASTLVDEPRDLAAEERAFESLKGVFPDIAPRIILHHLRLCGFDRQKVANAILSAQTRTDEDVEASLIQGERAARQGSSSGGDATSTTAPRPPSLDSCNVLTLCALFPDLSRKDVEYHYRMEKKDFPGAVEAIACAALAQQQKISSRSRWTTDGPTQSEKLKMERLEAMFPGLPHRTIHHCFLETMKQTPKAIEILSQMLRDTEDDLDARMIAGRIAMSGDMSGAPMEKVVVAYQATGDAWDDDTPTAADGARSAQRAVAVGSTPAASSAYASAANDLVSMGDWRRLREQAQLTSNARLQLLDMAVVAYANGNGRGAKSLALQAKALANDAKALNLLAMQALERERSSPNGLCMLDLHGFYASEALQITAARVRACVAGGASRLTIVTGVGLHSPGARPVLLPVVLEALRTDPYLSQRCSILRSKDGKIDVRIELDH